MIVTGLISLLRTDFVTDCRRTDKGAYMYVQRRTGQVERGHAASVAAPVA